MSNCMGDFFQAEGCDYYRCFRDGSVYLAAEPEACPGCGREIFATRRGEVPVFRSAYVLLPFPGGPVRVELPEDHP